MQSLLTPLPEPAPSNHAPDSRQQSAPKVAYVMSRFPKLTETFVLYEMVELEALGTRIEIYPLLRSRQPVIHRAAEELLPRANFRPFFSLSILYAMWYFIRRRPGDFFKTLFDVLWGALGSARYFAGALIYFPKSVLFAYEMGQKGVTHVHAHFANHPAVVALIIHRLTGIPFSFTAHGSDLHVDRHMLGQKVAAAKFVVSVSQYNKKMIVAESGEQYQDKIRVIHCGVNANAFEVRPKSSDRPLQIACVASLDEVKGHKYLIEACRTLKSRGIPFHCHFAGDGPLHREIANQIRESGLEDCIHMHGALHSHAVASLLADTDVVALASILTRDGRREGIPVVLMEAMASGLPIVASDLSGIPELVESGRTGILVPPQNANAIAKALETLAQDKDLRVTMGRAGREKVVREFNLHQSAQQLFECFRTAKSPADALGAAEQSEECGDAQRIQVLSRFR